MGIFDDIDRFYKPKPKPPIVLECEHCGTTEGTIIRRENWYRPADAVLCETCWRNWG
jgi:hypothetical protein